jgi:hypothetical protein
MQYKTLVLQLLRQRRELHNQLKASRTLLQEVDRYALELKAGHEAWQANLSQARPDSDPSQIASEALEMALKELEERLPAPHPEEDSEALSLEGAIAFIRDRTPTA